MRLYFYLRPNLHITFTLNRTSILALNLRIDIPVLRQYYKYARWATAHILEKNLHNLFSKSCSTVFPVLHRDQELFMAVLTANARCSAFMKCSWPISPLRTKLPHSKLIKEKLHFFSVRVCLGISKPLTPNGTYTSSDKC